MIWGVQAVITYFYDSSKRVGVFLRSYGLIEDYYEFFYVFKLGIDWIRSYEMVRVSKIVMGSFLFLSQK